MNRLYLVASAALMLILSPFFNIADLTKSARAEISPKTGWVVQCSKQKKCRVYSQILAKNKIVASSFSIIKTSISNIKEPTTIGIVILPLGLHLPSGVQIKVDDKLNLQAKLIECKLKGCRAIFQASPKIIDQLKKGKNIYIQIRDSKTRKNIILTYYLKGFSKAYEAFANTNKLAKSN